MYPVCYSYKIQKIPDMSMNKITFTAKYRGKRCSFEISPASGSNGTWHLYIDRYYYGQFAHRGRWVFLPQDDEAFTKEQIAILEGQLEKHWREQQAGASSE